MKIEWATFEIHKNDLSLKLPMTISMHKFWLIKTKVKRILSPYFSVTFGWGRKSQANSNVGGHGGSWGIIHRHMRWKVPYAQNFHHHYTLLWEICQIDQSAGNVSAANVMNWRWPSLRVKNGLYGNVSLEFKVLILLQRRHVSRVFVWKFRVCVLIMLAEDEIFPECSSRHLSEASSSVRSIQTQFAMDERTETTRCVSAEEKTLLLKGTLFNKALSWPGMKVTAKT